MRTLLAAVLAALSAAAAPSPGVVRAVAQLRHERALAVYWLGTRWHGTTLRLVARNAPADIELAYGDCSADELEVMALPCHHVVDLEETAPAQGEISTQGRCTYSATVRGAAVALFPVNDRTLRVFTPQTTLYVSAPSLRDELTAVHALRGLNIRLSATDPLPRRDVTKALGRCRAVKRKPHLPLTAKQAYEQKMKTTFSIETASTLQLLDWSHWAKPSAGVREFLRGMRTFPLLLRDQAERVSLIRPPRAVADLHMQLVRDLQTYADEVDVAVHRVRAGDWRHASWSAESAQLNARLAHDARAIFATAQAFRKRGYGVFVKPSGD